MTEVTRLANKLVDEGLLEHNEYIELLSNRDDEVREYLRSKAQEIAVRNYGRDIFLRGLIEYSNICKNDCYYCGIRKSNNDVERYRLSLEEILSCCDIGYQIGLRKIGRAHV